MPAAVASKVTSVLNEDYVVGSHSAPFIGFDVGDLRDWYRPTADHE